MKAKLLRIEKLRERLKGIKDMGSGSKTFKSDAKNPIISALFTEAYGIDERFMFFPVSASIDYLELRAEQNKHWAFQQTVKGIELARKNDLNGAIEKYDSAIEIDSNCVEAYVARGAALANQKKFNAAIKDLEAAVKINPEHKNARKYLNQLQMNQKRIQDEQVQVEKSLRKGEFVLPQHYDPQKTKIADLVSKDSDLNSRKRPRKEPR
jgi:tetratricopeptide (TPR) repeat protein